MLLRPLKEKSGGVAGEGKGLDQVDIRMMYVIKGRKLSHVSTIPF